MFIHNNNSRLVQSIIYTLDTAVAQEEKNSKMINLIFVVAFTDE